MWLTEIVHQFDLSVQAIAERARAAGLSVTPDGQNAIVTTDKSVRAQHLSFERDGRTDRSKGIDYNNSVELVVVPSNEGSKARLFIKELPARLTILAVSTVIASWFTKQLWQGIPSALSGIILVVVALLFLVIFPFSVLLPWLFKVYGDICQLRRFCIAVQKET